VQLDPRQLAIFLAVVRAGSLTAAARNIGLSQPGISASIAQLERSLGSRLLNRGRHGAQPTEAGKLLVRRSEAIEELLAQARKEVELQERGLAGPLTLAGTPGALMSIVPVGLRELRERVPRFELQIIEANDSDLVDLLRDRKADLTISTVEMESAPADVAEFRLLQDAFEFVLAKDNPFQSKLASLDEVRVLPWVLPAARGAFRRHVHALFLTNSVPLPDNAVLCDSLGTTKEIIRQTNYVTILPSSVAAPEVESGTLRTIALRERLVTRSLGVRRLKDATPTALATAFLDCLRKQYI
jgi:molybdate transport repressor ModE-like protein